MRITTLYHISDIHIRMYARHDEYQHVFAKLYDVLTVSDGGGGVIVITGDVLHNKIDLTPECCMLTHQLLTALGEIMPVVLIAGNHDALLNNRNRVDSLTSILHARTPPNVHYFSRTGVYPFHNLVFVVNSLLDDASWIVPEDVDHDQDDTIVALYHGQVGAWMNHAGFRSETCERTLADFRGADLVLLGDIHKHQYMDESRTVAYAGSLISQNFTETDDDHGVLVWDVENKTSHFIRLENPFAFKEIISDGHRLWMDGAAHSETTIALPSCASVRIKMSAEHAEHNRCTIATLLKRFPRIRLQTLYERAAAPVIDQQHQSDEHDMASIRQYVLARYPQYCDEIVRELSAYYQQFITSRPDTTDWHLVSLSFDHMFGYGKGNRIVFQDFPTHTMTGIFGKNSAGKSTLIDIIIFMLYGKITRSTVGHATPKEIIHHAEKKSHGDIQIRIGDEIFQITKDCTRQKHDKIKIVERLFCIQDGRTLELTDEQRRRTDKLIAEKIGSLENFLLTNVMLQQKERSFREMTQSNKKDFLYHLFHLDCFEKLRKEKEDLVKQTQIRLKLYQQDMGGRSIEEYDERIAALRREHADVQQEMTRLQTSVQHTTDRIEACLRDLVPVPNGDHGSSLTRLDAKIREISDTMARTRQRMDTITRECQEMDVAARRTELHRLETLHKPDHGDFDPAFLHEFGPQNPQNTREKWETEYDAVMRAFRQFPTIKNAWMEAQAHYEQQLQALRDERPSASSCTGAEMHVVPDDEWAARVRQHDPHAVEALHQEELRLTHELQQVFPDAADELLESQFQTMNVLCNEWKVKDSLWNVLREQAHAEDQGIIYNPDCAACMKNPHYVKACTIAEQVALIAQDRDHILQRIHQWMLERFHSVLQSDDAAGASVIDAFEKVHADFHRKKKHWHMQKKRLARVMEDLVRAQKEQAWIETQECWRQQKKIDAKIARLLRARSTDERKERYDRLLAIADRIPMYNEMAHLWTFPSERYIQSLRSSIQHYDDQQREQRVMEASLQAMQNELEDARIQRARIEEILKHVDRNNVIQKEISQCRTERRDLEMRLATVTDRAASLVNRVAQEVAAQDQFRQCHAAWTDLMATEKLLVSFLSIIDRDGLPLHLLKTKLPYMEEDINAIVRPFMEKSICFGVRDKDIILATKSTDESFSGFYGGMEAFILDIALKIVFRRFGKLPRSDFFFIDEGISVMDQDMTLNLNHLFEFLLTFNERVYIISHLPVVKDFVQNRIEIEKEERSMLRIYY